MRGSISKRGTKWSYVLSLGTDEITGKRVQVRRSGFITEAECERAMREELTQYDRGVRVGDEGHTVESWLEYWYENHVELELSPTTRAKYRSGIEKILPLLPNVRLEKLKAADVQKVIRALAEEKLKPATVRMYMEPLHAALNYAIERGMLYQDLFRAVSFPRKEPKELRVLTIEQAKKLLKETKREKVNVAIALAVWGGLRRGEVAGLKWSNVDLARKVMYVKTTRVAAKKGTVEKGPKSDMGLRPVAMTDQLEEILREKHAGLKQPTPEYVLSNDKGRPYTAGYATQMLRKSIAKHELPKISFHGLRHSFASIMISLGVDPKTVQIMMGHSRIAMTLDTYTHIMPGAQEEAARKLSEAIKKNSEVTKT